jgi:hypothetical protein
MLQHVLVARLSEIRLDHGFGIGRGVVLGKTHEAGRPQAQQFVAPRGHLEGDLLVALELGLESLFSFGEIRH